MNSALRETEKRELCVQLQVSDDVTVTHTDEG